LAKRKRRKKRKKKKRKGECNDLPPQNATSRFVCDPESKAPTNLSAFQSDTEEATCCATESKAPTRRYVVTHQKKAYHNGTLLIYEHRICGFARLHLATPIFLLPLVVKTSHILKRYTQFKKYFSFY